MWNTTIRTIRDNPRIILGFLIQTFLPVLVIIPSFGALIAMIVSLDDLSNVFVPATLSLAPLAIYALVFLVFLAGMMLILPSWVRLIFESVTQRVYSGWYQRGLRSAWWKPFVINLMLAGILIVFSIFNMISSIIPPLAILMVPLSLAVSLAQHPAMIIGHTAVVVEGSFNTGLQNAFKVGKKYFLKLLGTNILVNAPIWIIAITLYVAMIIMVVQGQSPMTEGMIIFLICFVVISIIYSIFIQSFLYTYSMHHYLESRQGINRQYPPSQGYHPQQPSMPNNYPPRY